MNQTTPVPIADFRNGMALLAGAVNVITAKHKTVMKAEDPLEVILALVAESAGLVADALPRYGEADR